MVESQTLKQYDTDTDIMRAIAAFFVVVIHASGGDTFSAVFYNSIARFSVPIFIIISGYYMLAHKTNGLHLTKKCTRLFLLILAWSGIYYVYGLLWGNLTFGGVQDMLFYLLTEPIHLWYLYAAIALYLFTPMLYVFCENAGQKQYLYALALTFFFGSLVVVLLRSQCFSILPVIVDKMKVPYTLGFVFLYLFGGYLQRYGVKTGAHRMVIYLAGVFATAVTVISPLVLPDWGLPKDLLLSFFAPNVLITAIAFFLFIQQAFRSFPIKSRKVRAYIHKIAGCTLGIYLLHPLIIMIFQSGLEQYYFSTAPYILIPIKTFLAYILSLALVFIVKKIPLLKWLA